MWFSQKVFEEDSDENSDDSAEGSDFDIDDDSEEEYESESEEESADDQEPEVKPTEGGSNQQQSKRGRRRKKSLAVNDVNADGFEVVPKGAEAPEDDSTDTDDMEESDIEDKALTLAMAKRMYGMSKKTKEGYD